MRGSCNMAEGTLGQQMWVRSSSRRHLQHVCADHAVSHSGAYWKEYCWREIRISNSVFQGVVRVMESSAEVLSRETARGGIDFVGLLVSKLEAPLCACEFVLCSPICLFSYAVWSIVQSMLLCMFGC